jgi:hypothetical protein
VPAYLNRGRRQHFVRYDIVLGDCGKDADNDRKEYRKALIGKMTRAEAYTTR